MDVFSLLLLFVFLVIPALFCASILTHKGYSYCFGFLFGLPLSYVGLIIALILPHKST